MLPHAAAEMVSGFLKSSSHNLRYIGIDSLARIVHINAKYAAEHQLAVIDCLEDPDDTLKKKTLELLYKMTKPSNVEVGTLQTVKWTIRRRPGILHGTVIHRIIYLRFRPEACLLLQSMLQSPSVRASARVVALSGCDPILACRSSQRSCWTTCARPQMTARRLRWRSALASWQSALPQTPSGS